MSKSDYLENALLNHTLRNIPYTPPATIYVALFLSTASDSAPGTEPVGNGYVRQPVTFGAPSAGSCSNTNVITFPAASPSGYGTIVAAGLFDAASGGNYLRNVQVLTPRTIQAGDAATFAAGTIVVTED